MAPHSSTLAGKSHGWRSLECCSPWGLWGSDTIERLPFHFSLSCIGGGNGNPLQCSCLENPRDGLPTMGSHRVGHDWSDLAVHQNGRPRDWDFNHIRLRSRTWNSEILPIQCLYSKLRQSYAPFWQGVITVIVAYFPKLKLSRTLWGSGVEICSVFSISCL